RGDAGCDGVPAHRPLPAAAGDRGADRLADQLRRRLCQLFPRRGDGRDHRRAADRTLSCGLRVRAQARRAGGAAAGRRCAGDAAMSFVETLLLPFQFEFMTYALVIAALVAVPMSLLSCFVVLKGWSLMG